MHRDSTAKLRLDRRLIQRRGWISPQELEAELEALPDVSHKVITLGEAEDDVKEASGDEGGSGDDEPAG